MQSVLHFFFIPASSFGCSNSVSSNRYRSFSPPLSMQSCGAACLRDSRSSELAVHVWKVETSPPRALLVKKHTKSVSLLSFWVNLQLFKAVLWLQPDWVWGNSSAGTEAAVGRAVSAPIPCYTQGQRALCRDSRCLVLTSYCHLSRGCPQAVLTCLLQRGRVNNLSFQSLEF